MKRYMIAMVLTAGAVAGSSPAMARGCNGVVNPFVWGCAPWDNNNGSNFPYYKRSEVKIPNGAAKVENKNGAPMINYNGQMMPVLRVEGANVVAAGGANVVSAGGAN